MKKPLDRLIENAINEAYEDYYLRKPVQDQGTDATKQEVLERGSPEELVDYAVEVLKSRWPEAEPIILNNLSAAFVYLREVLKERWPELEGKLTSPQAMYEYASIVKMRWPKAEKEILRDAQFYPSLAYEYARDVIGGRWLEAEPYIMKVPHYARLYAEDNAMD